ISKAPSCLALPLQDLQDHVASPLPSNVVTTPCRAQPPPLLDLQGHVVSPLSSSVVTTPLPSLHPIALEDGATAGRPHCVMPHPQTTMSPNRNTSLQAQHHRPKLISRRVRHPWEEV
ncbi:putative mucin-5AC isoform X1, partial [Sesbania bispinosa]